MVSVPPRQQLHVRPPSVRGPVRISWVVQRRFPLLATAALVMVGMLTTTWGAHLMGQPGWSLPHDLWRTMVAADRIRHLDVAGLYTPPTALVSFPGAALILTPLVAVVDATGGNLVFQSTQNPEPAAWLLAGPYEIMLSAVVLFAADAVARRCGADNRARALLAFAGAIALWNVSVRFGHPEDAVAVALLLWGMLAVAGARPVSAAWLIGAGIAVQPLILLGLPVVLAVLPVRAMPAFLARAAIPGVLVLGAAAVANFSATLRAVTSQPNWPGSHSNHVTPWTSFAPEVGGGAVSAGPGRIVAIVLALACAVFLMRRGRDGGNEAIWTASTLQRVLWWVALTLALRCVFESVMVSYYLWPVLAVALVASSASRPRLAATAVCACVLTAVAQASWHGPWVWWTCMVAGLAATLSAARPGSPFGRPGAGRLSSRLARR